MRICTGENLHTEGLKPACGSLPLIGRFRRGMRFGGALGHGDDDGRQSRCDCRSTLGIMGNDGHDATHGR